MAASTLRLLASALDPGAELSSVAVAAFGSDPIELPWAVALELAALGDEPLPADLRATLTEEDAEFLATAIARVEMPAETSLKLSLRADGVYGRPGFALKAAWQDQDGLPIDATTDGAFARYAGESRLMTLGQLRLLTVLDGLSDLGRDAAADQRAAGRAVGAIPPNDPGVVLDPFLANERFVEVDAVSPHLKPVSGGFQVVPRAHRVDEATLEQHYFAVPSSRYASPLRQPLPDGTRQNVVLSDRAVAGLHRTRAINKLSPRQAAKALTSPEEFFGPDLDTSHLAERVIGAGPRVASVDVYIREVQVHGWFDWEADAQLVAYDESGESATYDDIDLEDPAVRETMRAAIRGADEDQAAYIPHPSDPSTLIEVTPALREALRKLEELSEATEDGLLDQPLGNALEVHDNVDQLTFDESPDQVTLHRPTLKQPPYLEPGIALRAHQLEGYDWLVQATMSESPVKGVLLADDMGLGKTIQVLALLARLLELGRGGPHLVVAPVALLHNWVAEAKRFFGRHLLPAHVVRGASLPDSPEAMNAVVRDQRIVLVSYATMRRYEFHFASVEWDVVVLDEAQRIKNPGSQTARVARTLSSRLRLALTGTPVENSLSEFWAIYDWTLPGLLGSLGDFRRDFIDPIADGSQPADILAARLIDRISAVFMRRMKYEVAKELPPLEWVNRSVEFGPVQSDVYASIVRGFRARRVPVFAALQSMLAACAHPRLPEYDGKGPPLPSVSDHTFPKAGMLFSILDSVAAAEEKVLVFANRLAVQAWISQEATARYQVRAPIINGEITGSERRLRILDTWSSQPGFGVLVLSPRAAGVGLNITAANHVIHYTREWNPAIENQATDRAYRIGQTRPVNVYTITVTGGQSGVTVEEKLAELLSRKRQLMADFVVPLSPFEVKEAELVEGLFTPAREPAPAPSLGPSVVAEPAPPPCAPAPAGRPSPATPVPVAARATAPTPTELPPDAPRWAAEISDVGVRTMLLHIDRHGVVTETEAIGIVGSPRELRRFDRRRAAHLEVVPFDLQIEVVGGLKRYVRVAS